MKIESRVIFSFTLDLAIFYLRILHWADAVWTEVLTSIRAEWMLNEADRVQTNVYLAMPMQNAMVILDANRNADRWIKITAEYWLLISWVSAKSTICNAITRNIKHRSRVDLGRRDSILVFAPGGL